MKKFIVFALCVISTLTVFAEPFSIAKYKEVVKTKDWEQISRYAYKAQISEETNQLHIYGYASYIKFFLKKENLNITEFNEIVKKFEGKVKDQNTYKYAIAMAAASNGLEDRMLQFSNKLENRLLANVYNSYFSTLKNNEKIWQYGKKVLLIGGGYEDVNNATNIIHKMFRYKPSNITKEQQIAFLEQLAQMYPIPGTDFNKWKGFMGFVGFKYKQLTKKDLF